MPMELACPACGGLVEGSTEDEVVERAQEHSWAAHSYRLSREHVIAALNRPGPY